MGLVRDTFNCLYPFRIVRINSLRQDCYRSMHHFRFNIAASIAPMLGGRYVYYCISLPAPLATMANLYHLRKVRLLTIIERAHKITLCIDALYPTRAGQSMFIPCIEPLMSAGGVGPSDTLSSTLCDPSAHCPRDWLANEVALERIPERTQAS